MTTDTTLDGLQREVVRMRRRWLLTLCAIGLMVMLGSRGGWPSGGSSGGATGPTGPAGPAGPGLLVDATHVWLGAADDFQAACTALNTALDAANTDGWLYVYGGTHTVTTPLTCSGASATEILHVECIGGPVGKNPSGAGSGCKILPASSATIGATVATAWASWDGFYVEAEGDSADMAMKSTGSVIVKDSAMSYPNSSSNPAVKSVLTVDAGAATTPTAEITGNYFYLYCSDADSECNRDSSMVRIDLTETGNETNNAVIQSNMFDFDGTVKNTANTRPAAINMTSGDNISTVGNVYDLLMGDSSATVALANHPHAYYWPSITNVFLWELAIETYRGAGNFTTTNPYGEMQYGYQLGGIGMKGSNAGIVQFPAHDESSWIMVQNRQDAMMQWGSQRDGDMAWFPLSSPSSGCDFKLERVGGVGSGVGGIDDAGCAAQVPMWHFPRGNGPNSGKLCSGLGIPGSDSAREGDSYYDLTEDALCVCSNVGGSWAFRRTDSAGTCS